MGAPYFYDYINSMVSQVSPGTIHCKNTVLQQYFARYYLQRAMSVFKWALPDEWNSDYVKYIAYTRGYFTVFNAYRDGLGVIPQQGTLTGYGIYYDPTHIRVANPVFSSDYDLEIGTDCTVVKLQPGYCGIMDIVNYYADMAAMCSEAAGVNLFNSKVGYIFFTKDKSASIKAQALFDKIASGTPMVVNSGLQKNGIDNDAKNWEVFDADIKNHYIVDMIQDAARRFEMEFDTLIGIPNANTQKKERLITDEVRQNDFETRSICTGWLESLQHGFKQTNEMFGLNLSVDWRDDLKGGVGIGGGGKTVSDGTV